VLVGRFPAEGLPRILGRIHGGRVARRRLCARSREESAS
jgi:hypothetical protein